MINLKKNKGITLIEVLIACLVITMTLVTLTGAVSRSIELSLRSLRQAQANYLIEEGVEAVKSIRDSAWSNIANLTSDGITKYYLYFDNDLNIWELDTTEQILIDNIFDRSVIFDDVYRDGDDAISSSGTVDPRTKKVEVIIQWDDKTGQISKDLTFYLADIFN